MNKEYKVIITTLHKTYKSERLDLYDTFMKFLKYLKMNRMLDEYNKGDFITTTNPFTDETLIKRYSVEILVPYTIIEIRKLSKGSLNPEDFLKSLEFIKEKYYDEWI